MSPTQDMPLTLRARRLLRGALAFAGPDFALLALFLATLAALVKIYGASFLWTEGPITIAGSIGLGLVAFAFLVEAPAMIDRRPGALPRAGRRAREQVRDWGPFVVLMWAFESLETYTGVIRKDPIDDALYALDVKIFGVEPTVWAGTIHHPLLTDWMAFAYGSYFVMPMILATALSLRGRREDFREMSSALVVHLGIGFILFLIFPAGPPRYYQPLLDGGFHPEHLSSYFGLYEFQQGSFDSADPVRTRSAFPSLHCSLGLLTLFYAWRFGGAILPRRRKLYFWVCLPVVVSLWLSTVYLRHHWIPDIAAGFALAIAANKVAAMLRRRWPRARQPAPADHWSVPDSASRFAPGSSATAGGRVRIGTEASPPIADK